MYVNSKSLTARTVRTTVISCLLLGVIALFIGLSVYGSSIIMHSVRHAFETASHAQQSVTYETDSAALAKEVMAIYRSLTPEERQKMKTDPEEYRSFYSSIDTSVGGGGTWDRLRNLLKTFVIDLDDVYMGMYDEETGALVYIVNADENVVLYPGDWEIVPEREIRKSLSWDGTGMLYEVSRTEEYGWLCTAGYPIRDDSGEVCGFLLADVAVNNITDGMADYVVRVSLGILAATGVMVWFIRKRIKTTVADPIDAIADAAVAYVKGKKDGVEGDHFSALNIRTGDELENLGRVMADMEKDLAEHEDHIRTITAEKERINTELNMAARIQSSMLPSTFPAFPDRTEFDIFASMDAAREVGGDFYDFFLIDDDHLCLVIADVSGKGIPGALFMMISKVMIHNSAMQDKDPAEILSLLNESICSNNPMEMFVTVWIGILEISTGRLTAANAGHEYPALYRRGDGFTLFKDKHGLVAGAMPDISYTDYELRLEPGDKLFVYTDGVPEATSAEMELFGTDRMLEALNAVSDAGPSGLLSGVRASVDSFVKDAEQVDDLTMLGFEYRGNKNTE